MEKSDNRWNNYFKTIKMTIREVKYHVTKLGLMTVLEIEKRLRLLISPLE